MLCCNGVAVFCLSLLLSLLLLLLLLNPSWSGILGKGRWADSAKCANSLGKTMEQNLSLLRHAFQEKDNCIRLVAIATQQGTAEVVPWRLQNFLCNDNLTGLNATFC